MEEIILNWLRSGNENLTYLVYLIEEYQKDIKKESLVNFLDYLDKWYGIGDIVDVSKHDMIVENYLKQDWGN